MTNRELKLLLDSLSEDELDKQVCLYSGSVDGLTSFSAKSLNDKEYEAFCKDHFYDPEKDGISRLILNGEN